MATKILRLELFFERRRDCHAMQFELLITMTPRSHVRSAPMSLKKENNLQDICKRSGGKYKGKSARDLA